MAIEYKTIEYKVVNGTSYHVQTSGKIVDILEFVRKAGIRVCIFLGDMNDGRDLNEITKGFVKRSCGPIKIPLLVKSQRSTGGDPILDHYIVKITSSRKDGRVFYSHPNYHLPEAIPA